MAVLHGATLIPTKIELLRRWVPTQSWAQGVDTSTLESVGAFRFDDPEGEVGVETHVLRATDGQILQVPLTYRAMALDGAEASFITMMQHSVLGDRWVYDASGDPVYARTLVSTIVLGGEQAELTYLSKDGPETLPATTVVRGSGSPAATVPTVGVVTFEHDGDHTVLYAGGLEVRLVRVLDRGRDGEPRDDATLVGRWPGHDEWAVLATASDTTTA